MRVLHVVECYGGGVGDVVDSIVGVSPEVEHHIFWDTQDGRTPGEEFSTAHRMPGGLVARMIAFRKLLRSTAWDVVHAHSSWAGVYSRLVRSSSPVIYQPHAYKFADKSLGLSRFFFLLVEAILAHRTAAVVVLSPNEESLARRINPKQHLYLVPNVSRLHGADTGASVEKRSIVVMSGRLARQKDPLFFRDVALAVQRVDPSISFQWLGSGDEEFLASMGEACIGVSGWLSHRELQAALSAASLYLHTGRYEGFPMSVLDAATVGLPVLVRQIPAFEGSGLLTVRSSDDAAAAIVRFFANPEYAAQVNLRTEALNARMNASAQVDALSRLYSSVTAGGS